jgi:hypothetical protein
MTMPNFLIIGAGRSGTTALYQYLRQHPEIYMCPIKETNFFALEREGSDSDDPDHAMIRSLTRQSATRAGITDIATYSALFDGVKDETAIGEASPSYLHSSRAAERIRHHIPHAKLISILRNPADRAYSAHMARVAKGMCKLEDFAEVPQMLQGSGGSVPRQLRYVGTGFYYTHLRRYFDRFDRAQIRVYLYDDFQGNPVGMLRDLFQCLGVENTFVPDMSLRHAVTGIPRSRGLEVLLRRLPGMSPVRTLLKPLVPTSLRKRITTLKNRNLVKPPLAPEVRREWIELYRDDILQLQDLIGRDLSIWLELCKMTKGVTA